MADKPGASIPVLSHSSVRKIMTSAVMYVRPHQTSEECMALMTENRLRHLPVMDGGKLLGSIAIYSLGRALIDRR